MPWEATLYFQLDMNKEVFLFQFLWTISYAPAGSQIEAKYIQSPDHTVPEAYVLVFLLYESIQLFCLSHFRSWFCYL